MEINKTDKIIILSEYREQKSLNKNTQNNVLINPLSSEDIALIRPDSPDEGNVFHRTDLTNSQAYLKAKAKLIDYFKKEFIKSEEFKFSFGNLSWDEISDKVNESINLNRDKEWEKEDYNNRAFAFTGSIYGLYAEVAIDKKNGRLKDVLIEID